MNTNKYYNLNNFSYENLYFLLVKLVFDANIWLYSLLAIFQLAYFISLLFHYSLLFHFIVISLFIVYSLLFHFIVSYILYSLLAIFQLATCLILANFDKSPVSKKSGWQANNQYWITRTGSRKMLDYSGNRNQIWNSGRTLPRPESEIYWYWKRNQK